MIQFYTTAALVLRYDIKEYRIETTHTPLLFAVHIKFYTFGTLVFVRILSRLLTVWRTINTIITPRYNRFRTATLYINGITVPEPIQVLLFSFIYQELLIIIRLHGSTFIAFTMTSFRRKRKKKKLSEDLERSKNIHTIYERR